MNFLNRLFGHDWRGCRVHCISLVRGDDAPVWNGRIVAVVRVRVIGSDAEEPFAVVASQEGDKMVRLKELVPMKNPRKFEYSNPEEKE